jgi:uncharacterized protein (TIGR00730 family)
MEPEQREPATLDEELLEAETVEVRSTLDDADRIERIGGELEAGFRALAHVGAAVSIFGSARTPPGHPEYELACELARRLGQAGFAIITGGGPGIMRAANQGAHEVGAQSIGLDIDLAYERNQNAYVDLPLQFHYFFTRKVMFVRYASAFVVFPGGFGTLDELFEALTLIQTDKIHQFPVLLVGTHYWGTLVEWLRDPVAAEGKISPEDLDLLHVTDDLDEIMAIISAARHREARQPRR